MKREQLNEYDFDVQTYSNATLVDTNCIDLLFINQGTNTAFVKNVPLIQNQSVPIGGNVGEIITRPVQISFDPAGIGTNSMQVIRRFYVNLED